MTKIGRVVLLCTGHALAGCNPNLENTATPPGDVSAYPPFDHVPQVLAFAGKDAKLLEMTAVGVPSNGKIPLTADASAQVMHQLTAKDDKNRYVAVRVDIVMPREYSVSQSDDRETRKKHLGMHRQTSPFNAMAPSALDAQAIALPKCSAAELWKKAIATGAPADRVATIVYNAEGYELRILTPTYLARRFDRDCNAIERK